MSSDKKADQTLAVIAALQSILDKLPDNPDFGDDAATDQEQAHPAKDPTHELFVGPLNQHSLAGLFTSIRIIHTIHNGDD